MTPQDAFFLVGIVAGMVFIFRTLLEVWAILGGSGTEHHHAHVIPLSELPDDVRERLKETLEK